MNTAENPVVNKRRSLRPQYGTIDGKFGSKPIKPFHTEPVDHVKQTRENLYALFKYRYNLQTDHSESIDDYAKNLYDRVEWVDCMTIADRRLETRKDIDNMVLRYCANKKNIPSHVKKDDIHHIHSPFKSDWRGNSDEGFGYGYFVQMYTDPSPMRTIERDVMINEREGCYIDALNACEYKSKFMEYYNDEFTSEEYRIQCEKEERELLEKAKEIDKQQRENMLLERELYLEDSDQEQAPSSPTGSVTDWVNDDGSIVINCD